MTIETELAALRAQVEKLSQQVAILQDKDEITRLQYTYGYLMDNRMFNEMVDLFADEGAWMEIGGRGRYYGKANIYRFLHEVLGDGRWGLLKHEVINHVQEQPIITVDDDRQHAWMRARAQVQGNSPPDTPHFLLADGIYENAYIREGGRWKIQGVTVTMTYYAALERDRVSFPTAPPSAAFPPDVPSQPVVEALGRQFNPWHFEHPITGKALPVPASALNPHRGK